MNDVYTYFLSGYVLFLIWYTSIRRRDVIHKQKNIIVYKYIEKRKKSEMRTFKSKKRVKYVLLKEKREWNTYF